MANVTLTPQQNTAAGITPTRTGSLSTSNTYLVPNDGRVILQFQKSEAAAATITVQTPKTVGGLAVAELTITVAASSGDVSAGPFPPSIYNAAGILKFTSSNVAGLTVAVLKI